MGILRFSFGTMGSGKSTFALQIHHNLRHAGLKGILLTRLDRQGSRVTSRLGISEDAIEVGEQMDLYIFARATPGLEYLVCDEAQFFTREQCDQLALAVDELGIDVYTFGLITDFKGLLFDGTKRLLELADERMPVQVEARCWCGARAAHNARIVNGEVVYEGETIVVGDTELAQEPLLFGDQVRYELMCRRHWRSGLIKR